MWLHTTDGFVSLVEHRDEPDLLLVRARARRDLDQFIGDVNARVWRDNTADYPWRAILTRDEVAAQMSAMVHSISYDNFKSAAGQRLSPERVRILHNIWGLLLDVEEVEEPMLAAERPWWMRPLDSDVTHRRTIYLDPEDDLDWYDDLEPVGGPR